MSLTLADARERTRLLRDLSYDVELDLTRGPQVFASRTTVRFGCTQPGSSVTVDLRDAAELRVVLNGRPVDGLVLPGLEATNELVVTCLLPYVSTGEGMHRWVDPVDGEVYVGAYLGVGNAQRVFACFDQPDLKGTFTTTVRAPEGCTVLGNSDAVLEGDRWELAVTPPLSPYLFVVLSGPWHSHRRGRYGWHCRASLAAHLDREADELFALTSACFERYAELFDEPYAWGSYDSVLVPELNWGAMESPGCVTFRDDYVFRSEPTEGDREERGMVIAHEMAHMWFGDLVTMRWWDDLWLSESFAEWMGYQVLAQVSRFTGTWTGFAISRKPWGYDADQRPSTHPVAPDGAQVQDVEAALENFDGISYAKGASALRQLVAWLGEDVFLAGANAFVSRHRFGAATFADLLEALREVSGEDVHGWADAWLRTTGVDTLRGVRLGTEVHVRTEGSRPHVVAVSSFEVEPVRLLGTVTGVDRVAAAPLVVVNDGDLTYAKVRLDPESAALVEEHLGELPDPLTRAVLWTSLRDQVRDAELAPERWLDLLARHLPGEPDLAVADGVLRFGLTQVAARYAADRPAALRLVAGVCRGRAELPFLRALLASADAEELRALRLDDPDLRWRALRRRCVLGDATAAEVSAELRRDPAGELEARSCAAALPSGKQEAWELVFDSELSVYEVTAVSRGLWQPEQEDQLAQAGARFFDAALAVTARRGQAFAEAVGFPVGLTPEVLAEGRACLASGRAGTALARVLVDQLDDLRRALEVRSSGR